MVLGKFSVFSLCGNLNSLFAVLLQPYKLTSLKVIFDELYFHLIVFGIHVSLLVAGTRWDIYVMFSLLEKQNPVQPLGI